MQSIRKNGGGKPTPKPALSKIAGVRKPTPKRKLDRKSTGRALRNPVVIPTQLRPILHRVGRFALFHAALQLFVMFLTCSIRQGSQGLLPPRSLNVLKKPAEVVTVMTRSKLPVNPTANSSDTSLPSTSKIQF